MKKIVISFVYFAGLLFASSSLFAQGDAKMVLINEAKKEAGEVMPQTLKKLGYKNAKNLKGGIQDWAKAGYSVKTGLGITKLTTKE
ncbi:MAG: rhodanese-like domain-containing protein [Sulfurimonas sp.]|uniref:rhodanese-like domain-containing protein n=1 Tax=Sulfurimonas sp. TaxID=2022749 RepID=UPI00261BAE4D|nr:rhodanese-like domain-containing protein [Sulfurimonas sp.]MDD5373186.1 rhodanese-like domain-containing protein [Sulfurimonas sp.]